MCASRMWLLSFYLLRTSGVWISFSDMLIVDLDITDYLEDGTYRTVLRIQVR